MIKIIDVKDVSTKYQLVAITAEKRLPLLMSCDTQLLRQLGDRLMRDFHLKDAEDNDVTSLEITEIKNETETPICTRMPGIECWIEIEE
jgi:hypothetical protein